MELVKWNAQTHGQVGRPRASALLWLLQLQHATVGLVAGTPDASLSCHGPPHSEDGRDGALPRAVPAQGDARSNPSNPAYDQARGNPSTQLVPLAHERTAGDAEFIGHDAKCVVFAALLPPATSSSPGESRTVSGFRSVRCMLFTRGAATQARAICFTVHDHCKFGSAPT